MLALQEFWRCFVRVCYYRLSVQETMQLFMHDDGRAEAEAAAQADLRKHLRAHFASGDAAATGACGLVSVLQRGLCAYATWYSAVSKITASKEPCGGLLQLNRLVKRIHACTPPHTGSINQCLWVYPSGKACKN